MLRAVVMGLVVQPLCILAKEPYLQSMSAAFAYSFEPDPPASSLRDLDDVVLLVDAQTMDGATISAGTEGTVVSVFRDGEAYLVEFSEPEGSIVSVRPDQLRAAA